MQFRMVFGLRFCKREIMKKRLYHRDVTVIVHLITFMWIVLGAVCFRVASILEWSGDAGVAFMLSAMAAVGLLCTASLAAVLSHLKRRGDEIYEEDVHNLFLLGGMSGHDKEKG